MHCKWWQDCFIQGKSKKLTQLLLDLLTCTSKKNEMEEEMAEKKKQKDVLKGSISVSVN